MDLIIEYSNIMFSYARLSCGCHTYYVMGCYLVKTQALSVFAQIKALDC